MVNLRMWICAGAMDAAHSPRANILSVLWSRNGSRLFSAANDKTIRRWNSDTGEQIALYPFPVGSILAIASWDKTLRFWDGTLGHPTGQPLEHDEGVFPLPLVNSWHQQESVEGYICGGYLGWIPSRAGHATACTACKCPFSNLRCTLCTFIPVARACEEQLYVCDLDGDLLVCEDVMVTPGISWVVSSLGCCCGRKHFFRLSRHLDKITVLPRLIPRSTHVQTRLIASLGKQLVCHLL
ncbi:hypothetical protein OG21DRAFT_1249641 [Imleria badia]|nr:hypothetical protein OG21DRAFT_1249641 [Imleria badia]